MATGGVPSKRRTNPPWASSPPGNTERRSMSTGTIGRLVKDHGFGFIKAAEGIDLFFHRSEVEDASFGSLHEGQQVKFKVSLSPRGLKATDIRLLKK